VVVGADYAPAVSDSRPLIRRISIAARDYANASVSARPERLGYVRGLLEAGVVLGYWQRTSADSVAELVRHNYRLNKIPTMLLKAQNVELITAAQIARLLDVSEQRVNQLAAEGRLPKPATVSGRTRLWEREEVEQWADESYFPSRRWRIRTG
jgi:excisionase family DNA binding protein